MRGTSSAQGPGAGIFRLASSMDENAIVEWIVLGRFVLALAVLAWWVLRSFKKWPPTPSERTSFIWGRRGGGDM